MSLHALRQQLAAVIAPPPLPGGGLSTGIAALDAALSGGGLPYGRLTEIAGTRGSGKTTLVRAIVAQALADKRWVAYIDTGRTLAPSDWAPLAATERLWIVRPPPGKEPGGAQGPWCADVLLRSGAFGLVVLDGSGPLAHGVGVRLTRLARESHAAFVMLQDDAEDDDGRRRGPRAGSGSAVRLRVRRHRREALVMQVSVEKGGTHHVVEVGCAIAVARRMCTDSPVPDRRGVATRNRRGERGAPDAPGARPAVAPPHGAGGRDAPPPHRPVPPHASGATLANKRRCASPAIGRDAFLLGPGPGDGRRDGGDVTPPLPLSPRDGRRKPPRPDTARHA